MPGFGLPGQGGSRKSEVGRCVFGTWDARAKLLCSWAKHNFPLATIHFHERKVHFSWEKVRNNLRNFFSQGAEDNSHSNPPVTMGRNQFPIVATSFPLENAIIFMSEGFSRMREGSFLMRKSPQLTCKDIFPVSTDRNFQSNYPNSISKYPFAVGAASFPVGTASFPVGTASFPVSKESFLMGNYP